VEGTAETKAGLKRTLTTVEMTVCSVGAVNFETEAMDDWSMILQSGLWAFFDWQQLCVPDIFSMEQAALFAVDAVLQKPQGVRAIRTPRMRAIRLR
jgi:hypothetical protein